MMLERCNHKQELHIDDDAGRFSDQFTLESRKLLPLTEVSSPYGHKSLLFKLLPMKSSSSVIQN